MVTFNNLFTLDDYIGEKMPILIVDDEQWNVSKLEALLNKYPGREAVHDYASTFEDAVGHLRETSYSAVILDFNMDRLNGKQFLSLLKGEFYHGRSYDCSVDDNDFSFNSISDEEIREAIEESFDSVDDYRGFVDSYRKSAFVLFSGTRFGDNEYEPILDGVYVEVKNNSSNDDSAERRILQHLANAGILRESGLKSLLE